jgi:hypothetical protein
MDFSFETVSAAPPKYLDDESVTGLAEQHAGSL